MFTALFAALALQAAQPFPESAETPRLNLADLDFLQGCWAGDGLGAQVQECWMAGPSGRLTGMFELLNADGTQRFSEIFVLDRFEDGPALRLKHFNADLTGWEAQDAYVSFPLIETAPGRAVFEGLEMQLSEAGALLVDLRIAGADGPRIERFTYARIGSSE